jgi:hypothetical protein
MEMELAEVETSACLLSRRGADISVWGDRGGSTIELHRWTIFTR